jgi:hypothetical protein
MTECIAQFQFPFHSSRKVVARFDGGDITSDAGLLWLREVEEQCGIVRRLSERIYDDRDATRVTHPLYELLLQRILQIAAGYEDCNDASELRHDPALLTCAGRTVGEEAEALASQPTLSRLENSVHALELISLGFAFVDHYLDKHSKRPPKRIVLDLDPTDDPTHGQQEFAQFHAYFDQHMYFPLLVFDGERGDLLAAVLRPGRCGAAAGAPVVLKAIVNRIRSRWPRTKFTVRGDSSFAVPELLECCESLGLDYAIGFARNSVVVRLGEKAMKRARQRHVRAKRRRKIPQATRVFTSFQYKTKSWTHRRRIVMKAEVSDLGDNPRFVVTSLKGTAKEIYEYYCARGQMENYIKDLKNAVRADRLSCHALDANQFRLTLHAGAYVLLHELRQQLQGTELEGAQLDTIRLRIIKVGAIVCQSVRRIWFHLASGYPYRRLWEHLARRLLPAAAPG